MSAKSYVNKTLDMIKVMSSRQPIFLQCATEVLRSVVPLLEARPEYEQHAVLERLVMPERTIIFRVVYAGDDGRARTHFGYRVQFSSVLGPYKGGLRFHPSVNLDILKFLGFEQIFKNSLTGLYIGGAKGGANFDPKGKSEAEIMRFCQAYMSELSKHIGYSTDVPAGDIGVGARELGYMFGAYKKITSKFDGTLTGKKISWGGSLVRKEATGYGTVYFARELLAAHGMGFSGKTCAVSGSGNVAIYLIEKLQEYGAKCITASDSDGYVYDAEGIDLALLKQVKEVERGRISDYAARKKGAIFVSKVNYEKGTNGVWAVPCDYAFPCATQNELSLADAKNLLANGCVLIAEGANMPCMLDAQKLILDSKIFYAPAKAANAGGVATSALEMQQNATMSSWSFEQVDRRLDEIMRDIYARTSATAAEFGFEHNLLAGANIAGFAKVADAMIDQGYI